MMTVNDSVTANTERPTLFAPLNPKGGPSTPDELFAGSPIGGEVDRPARERVHGRFYIQHDDDGWTVVDSDTGSCLSWDTRAEAEQAAKFARDYVRKWGRIDFQCFPLSLDEPPV